MQLDRDKIFKIAELARLHITEEDVDGLRSNMNKILTFMEKLNELDTSGVEPLRYMNHEVNRWREDEVKPDISQKEVLMNAPLHNDQYFMVPKIMEK